MRPVVWWISSHLSPRALPCRIVLDPSMLVHLATSPTRHHALSAFRALSRGGMVEGGGYAGVVGR